MRIGHWETTFDMTNVKAFVYLITFTELNLFYIGAKKIISANGNETNWKHYRTSSKKVKALLDAGHTADFDVFDVFDSWDCALHCEDELLRANNVLYDDMWLNESYGGRGGGFVGKKHTKEAKARTGAAHLGKKRSAATRARMGVSQKARTDNRAHTAAAKVKISEAMKGKTRTTETIDKWRKSLSPNMYHTPDGIFSSTEAALYYNCSRQTIITRCANIRPKWALWYSL